MNTTSKTDDLRMPSLFSLGKRFIGAYKAWRLDRIVVQGKKEYAAGKTFPLNTREDFRRLLEK